MSVITSETPNFLPEEPQETWEDIISAAGFAKLPGVEIEPVNDPAVPSGHFNVIHDVARPGNPHYEAAKPYMNMFSDDSDK
jgi:hypothetical protein